MVPFIQVLRFAGHDLCRDHVCDEAVGVIGVHSEMVADPDREPGFLTGFPDRGCCRGFAFLYPSGNDFPDAWLFAFRTECQQ